MPHFVQSRASDPSLLTSVSAPKYKSRMIDGGITTVAFPCWLHRPFKFPLGGIFCESNCLSRHEASEFFRSKPPFILHVVHHSPKNQPRSQRRGVTSAKPGRS